MNIEEQIEWLREIGGTAHGKANEVADTLEKLYAVYEAILPLKVSGKPIYHLDSKLNAAIHMAAQIDVDAAVQETE